MNNLAELVRRLPEPYEDELWYSVLSRYHRMSGNLTERETYREIMPDMIKGAESSIPILTINNYSIWLMKGDERKLRDIYFEHTLEPYWFRFSKTNSKRSAYVQSITKPQNKKADTIVSRSKQEIDLVANGMEAMGLSIETGYFDPDDEPTDDVPKQLMGFYNVRMSAEA